MKQHIIEARVTSAWRAAFKLCSLTLVICGSFVGLNTAVVAAPYTMYGMGEPNPSQIELPRSARLGGPAVRDLELYDLTTTTENVPAGLTRLVARVRNVGTVDVGSTKTAFRDGSTVIGAVATGPISAGGGKIVWFDYRLSGGAPVHAITAKADATNSVIEANKQNNAKTIAVRAGGKDIAARN
ncbi:MAG: hypothetical protein M3Z64_03275 [Verrucomicrobiota bacterium]|nr:hypothetical protein [Verrucomicrobiota bacterium]